MPRLIVILILLSFHLCPLAHYAREHGGRICIKFLQKKNSKQIVYIFDKIYVNASIFSRIKRYRYLITNLWKSISAYSIVSVKPMHNIGKVSLNASILYKNHEICHKTNLWKFQLISLFLLRENSKHAFSIFVFIPIDEFQIDPVRALPHSNRGSLCQVTTPMRGRQ